VLRAETMRFSDELRTADDLGLPSPGKLDRAKAKAIGKAIKALAADDLDRSELTDEYAAALTALAERKRKAGDDVVVAPVAGADEQGGEEEPQANLVDLMAVLKRRLGERASMRAGASSRRASVSTDLDSQTREELYERAKALGISGRSRMSRDQLVAAIRRAS
jgi:DNA end-binding protein Ku